MMRLPATLWVIGGLMSGGITFFGLDPLTLAVFIGGAVVGVVIGLTVLLRPSAAVLMASDIAGVAWLLGFGVVVVVSIGNPLEEWLSVVTICCWVSPLR